ncbi:hypothetical protein [Borrelia miyamotoi]
MRTKDDSSTSISELMNLAKIQFFEPHLLVFDTTVDFIDIES